MKFPLYKDVVLLKDMPEEGLKRGDIGTVVAFHPVEGGVDGYTLEFFNALGETITVVTVPESAIRAFGTNDILAVRQFQDREFQQLSLAESKPIYKTED